MESKVKIPLETGNVVISGMKDFLDVRPGEKAAQVAQIFEGKGIQQEIAFRAGKLNQANPLMIGMQAVRFGIDRNSILSG